MDSTKSSATVLVDSKHFVRRANAHVFTHIFDLVLHKAEKAKAAPPLCGDFILLVSLSVAVPCHCYIALRSKVLQNKLKHNDYYLRKLWGQKIKVLELLLPFPSALEETVLFLYGCLCPRCSRCRRGHSRMVVEANCDYLDISHIVS